MSGTHSSHGISRSAHGRTSNYIHALHASVDGSFVRRDDVKVISVVTAGDPSHSLTPEDSGEIWVTGELLRGSTITLPSGTLSGVVGTYYRIKMITAPETSISIALPNGDPAELVGSVLGRSTAAINTNNPAILVSVAASDNMQGMILDPDAPAYGGAPGTEIELLYVDSVTVSVCAQSVYNSGGADTAVTVATFFQAGGYA